MVRLNAVTRPGGARIELQTAPILRCPFAESLAAWLRDEAAPRADKQLGPALTTSFPFGGQRCDRMTEIIVQRICVP